MESKRTTPRGYARSRSLKPFHLKPGGSADPIHPGDSAFSINLRIPHGLSSLETAMALIRSLQEGLGAIVTEVDVGAEGGRFALTCRQPKTG